MRPLTHDGAHIPFCQLLAQRPWRNPTCGPGWLSARALLFGVLPRALRFGTSSDSCVLGRGAGDRALRPVPGLLLRRKAGFGTGG
jgi:hypothetical protein